MDCFFKILLKNIIAGALSQNVIKKVIDLNYNENPYLLYRGSFNRFFLKLRCFK